MTNEYISESFIQNQDFDCVTLNSSALQSLILNSMKQGKAEMQCTTSEQQDPYENVITQSPITNSKCELQNVNQENPNVVHCQSSTVWNGVKSPELLPLPRYPIAMNSPAPLKTNQEMGKVVQTTMMPEPFETVKEKDEKQYRKLRSALLKMKVQAKKPMPPFESLKGKKYEKQVDEYISDRAELFRDEIVKILKSIHLESEFDKKALTMLLRDIALIQYHDVIYVDKQKKGCYTNVVKMIDKKLNVIIDILNEKK